MSARTVISVRNLGKRYELGETFSSTTLRDALAASARYLLRRSKRNEKPEKDFWALRNVSFDVAEGEVVGIIGHNGAGKSTLLKILSGITDPTEGEVRMRGRVGALLEVGTGFHQELSGRENISMNGAILGMSQAEIRRKFDEIVGFAGVEPFIDTPVKRYSSGMLVRLGFAVAAHLQPEILVVDEVLAVGDEEFQRKCIRKMDEASRSGRTILFVSHNMAAIEALCSRCVLLKNGAVIADGGVADVISTYRAEKLGTFDPVVQLTNHSGRPRGRPVLMQTIRVRNEEGKDSTSFLPGETVCVIVDHDATERPISPVLGVVVRSSDHAPILGVDNRTIAGFRFAKTKAAGRIACSLPDLPLVPGAYSVDVYFGDSFTSLDIVRNAAAFEIRSSDVYGTGRLPPPGCGPLLWRARWTWERSEGPSDVSGSNASTARFSAPL